MWEYIKNVQGTGIGFHIIKIFNFIMNNILILCEEDKNPITYFVGVIDESVKWFLRSVYKDSIIYDDTISTENIQGINIDNLKAYSYNDTIARINQIAFKEVFTEIENLSIRNMAKKKVDVDQFHIKLKEQKSRIKYISPLTETLVYPILSKMTGIPYQHFKTLSPPQAAFISKYIQKLLIKVFGSDYEKTFNLLEYYPEIRPSVSTTYILKANNYYLDLRNEVEDFFGFKLKTGIPHKFICHFIGRIPRTKFVKLVDGTSMGGIPLTTIEKEVTHFFVNLFAGNLDSKIKKMTKLMNADF
jgi:hypothetical protein